MSAIDNFGDVELLNSHFSTPSSFSFGGFGGLSIKPVKSGLAESPPSPPSLNLGVLELSNNCGQYH